MPAWRSSPTSRRFDTSGLTMLLVAALVLCGLTASAPRRVHATGAVGIVVRHGDGRLLYAYIPLTGDQITGAEALMHAGLPLNLQASSSLGAAVCTIDGEGCNAPKEDCFCKSYGDPAFYWHYYVHRPNGAWANANLGAGNRVLHDGDIDGWSWTAGDSGLPAVTLEQIAALVQMPAAAAPSPPLPTPGAMPTVMPTAAPTSTALPIILTATASATASLATAPAPAIPSLPATVSATAPPSSPTLPSATTGEMQPRAVVVGPNGTVTPVRIAPPPSDTSGGRTFAIFAAVAGAMLALLAIVPRGARRRGRGGGGNP